MALSDSSEGACMNAFQTTKSMSRNAEIPHELRMVISVATRSEQVAVILYKSRPSPADGLVHASRISCARPLSCKAV